MKQILSVFTVLIVILCGCSGAKAAVQINASIIL